MIYNLLNRYPFQQQAGDGGGGSGRARPTVEDVYDPLFFVVNRLERSFEDANRVVGAVRFPIISLTKAIRQFALDAVTLQRSFLTFNKTFATVLSSNQETLEGLPGGLRQSLESLFRFQSEGLMNVGKNSLTLANRMSITGQNVAALVKINKSAITQGLLSNAATDTLNRNVLNTGLRFGVSTELLIESMGQLGESLTVLGLTGGAGPVMESVSKLTAKFPAFGDSIGKFVDAVVTADIGQLARLGILQDVDKLLAGQITVEELIKKTQQGAGAFGDMQGGGLIETRLRMGIIGQAGILAEQITRGMEQARAREPDTGLDQIFADFKTALSTFIAPFAEQVGLITTGLLNVGTKILSLADGIGGIKVVVNAFMAYLITRGVTTRIMDRLTMASRERNTMSVNKLTAALLNTSLGAGGALMPKGFVGIFGGVFTALLVLPSLLEMFGFNQSALVEAEVDRTKAELAQIKRDEDSANSFESFSRLLINEQVRRAETFNSAMTVAMTTSLSEVVDAVDRTTAAVEDTDREPTLVRGNKV